MRQEQRAQRRMADVLEPAHQLGPHLVHRPRRRQNAVVLAEAVGAVPFRHDAPDLVEDDLEPAVEQVGAALRLDELAGVELQLQRVHVLKDLRADLAGGILQDEIEILGAAAAGTQVLARAEEEAPAAGGVIELGDAWKACHLILSGGLKPAGYCSSRRASALRASSRNPYPRFSHWPPSTVSTSPVM